MHARAPRNDRQMHRFRRLGFRAFTLIELIVVVIVLGLLMAVALPSFFGASTAAQDSAAKQYLSTSYRAAKLAQAQADGALISAASVVAALRSSEPELNFTTGTPSAANDPKTVIVQTDVSDAQALTLGIASNSGKVCTLTVNAASSYTPVSSCGPSSAFQGISLSGNEITNATRALGVQGDGLAAPAGAGIWEGTTNLVTDGGFETNTATWVSYNPGDTATLTRDTGQFKFGAASLKVVTTTGGGSVPGAHGGPYNLALATPYTFSAWVNVTAGSAVNLNVYGNGLSALLASSSPSVGFGWQRLTVTFTSSATVSAHDFFIARNTGAGATTFYVDGAQVEQKLIATPYVETNGATGTRNAARAFVANPPSTLLNATQGWVAARVRIGFASSAARTSRVFTLSDSVAGSRVVGVLSGSNTWQTNRPVITNSPAVSAVQTWAAGDLATVVFAWTATSVTVSANGGSFVTSAIGGTFTPDTFDLGTGGTVLPGAEFDGNILWLATGTGTLSDANAASINSLPNTNPNFTPWLATGVWSP